jgi:hypothetical protein
MVKESAEKVRNLMDDNPTLVRELSHKRSLKIKNPQFYSNINELPKKALQNCLTAVILKGDKEAVTSIIHKI